MAIKRTNLGGGASVFPEPPTGHYMFTASPSSATTNAGHVTGSLRVVPWVLTQAITIDRLGAEVTTVGDTGSKVRLGIYNDTGSCYPRDRVLDAGQINGDAAGVQELTVSQVLQPGLYWVGGVIQTVTTTQPILRVVNNWFPPIRLTLGTSMPQVNGTIYGFQQTGVTGALPATFSSTVNISNQGVRTFVRLG